MRQKELEATSNDGIDGRLKLAAPALDARLKADELQTICHGDAKGANIMYDAMAGISFYDFQWVGKAPLTKDLAYFMMCGACGLTLESEDEYLRYYLKEFSAILVAQKDDPPSFEYLWNSYVIACVDLERWMAGWGRWGNRELLCHHTETLLDQLDGGQSLSSEQEYNVNMCAAFPSGTKSKSLARSSANASASVRTAATSGAVITKSSRPSVKSRPAPKSRGAGAARTSTSN